MSPKLLKRPAAQEDQDFSIDACLQLSEFREQHGVAAVAKIADDLPTTDIRSCPAALVQLRNSDTWGKLQMQAVKDFCRSLQSKYGSQVPDLLAKYNSLKTLVG